MTATDRGLWKTGRRVLRIEARVIDEGPAIMVRVKLDTDAAVADVVQAVQDTMRSLAP